MSLTDGGWPGERTECLVEVLIDLMDGWPEETLIERSLDAARPRFDTAIGALRSPMRLRLTR